MKKELSPSFIVTIVAVAAGLVLAYSAVSRSLHPRESDEDDDDDDDDDDDENDCDVYEDAQQYISSDHRPAFPNPTLPMSKKGVKKQMKYERKVQNRKLKKQKERQKRRQEALSQGRDLQKEQELVAQRTMNGDGWRRRQEIWEAEKLPSVRQSFHICIDCSYEPLMTKKEITSLAAQIRCCYAYNKRNNQPCQMVATNLSMQQSPETLQLLQNENGYNEWINRAYVSSSLSPVEFYCHSDGWSSTIIPTMTASKAERQEHRITKIVYLTSDSENTLLTLDNNTVYVIGGIVDRNRHKGIAYARARSLRSSCGPIGRSHHPKYNGTTTTTTRISVSTAKLPLTEYIAHMPSTPVLTINHVFHILLQYRNSNNDWNAAFQAVLPARKEAQYIYCQKDNNNNYNSNKEAP